MSKNENWIAERMRIKIELLSRLEKLSAKIIDEDGYSEMADGCDRAIDEVEQYFNEVS